MQPSSSEPASFGSSPGISRTRSGQADHAHDLAHDPGTKFILAVSADGTTAVGVLEGAVEVSPCGGNQPVTEPSGQAVRVARDCKSDTVSLDSVTTDVTTSTDYDVAEAPGTAPEVGGTSDLPNNGEGHSGVNAAMAAAGGSGGGSGGGGRGKAAVADLVGVVATPTTSLS